MGRLALGISPLVDFAFKAILGNPDHPRVALHFLNALLAPPHITEVQFLKPFLAQAGEDDKLAVRDVRVRDEHRRYLNIEVQAAVMPALAERLVYYAARQFAGQLTEGEP